MTINGQPVVVRTTDASISTENHMQVFARLASITNMHGTPGPRKGRGGGKK
jgi:hypothetical protein